MRNTTFSLFCMLTAIPCSAFAEYHYSGRLNEQIQNIPEEFKGNIINVPLSARIILNNKILGDAVVILSADNTVQILEFTDSFDSTYSDSERQKWLQALGSPLPLGECQQHCPDALLALDYNLASAQLSLVTDQSKSQNSVKYLPLPEQGSTGLILNNQLTASDGEKQTTAMGWTGEMLGSIGNWTAVGGGLLSRDGNANSSLSHAATSLYAQREFEGYFLRMGLFTPDNQGVLRQPYSPGLATQTSLGLMWGTSDTRLVNSNQPSMYPVYVTANREGKAEIYRNGILINNQPLEPGLQLLDTSVLPSGVYQIEIRVIEDGKTISRTNEMIYKPVQWSNLQQRLLYNLYLGQERTLWNNNTWLDDSQDLSLGATVNYLLTPSLTGGVMAKKAGAEKQQAVSLEWQPMSSFQLYGNLFHSQMMGNGFDAQALWQYEQGNVVVNYSRSQLFNWGYSTDKEENDFSRRYRYTQMVQNGGISINHRLSSLHTLNARLSKQSQNGGVGVDVGFSTRPTLFGTDVNLRFSAYDRPMGTYSSGRNRGFSFTTSFAFGPRGRDASVSLGTRSNGSGGQDHYASTTLRQNWQKGALRETSATLTADRYGAGLSSWNQIDTQWATGSLWAQSSTKNSQLSGGVNANSTLALGDGNMVFTRNVPGQSGAGVIIDVESEENQSEIVANSLHGSYMLKPGRNFVPVEAWKARRIEFDFAGGETPALKITPVAESFLLNRGGVAYSKLRVMRTLTVVGRVTDKQGMPLGGSILTNHAGRTVSETDGFFTLELQENHPSIAIETLAGVSCEIMLTPGGKQRKGDVLFAGDIGCHSKTDGQG